MSKFGIMADEESEVFGYLRENNGPEKPVVDGEKGGEVTLKKDLSNHEIKSNNATVIATTNWIDDDGATTSDTKTVPNTNAGSGAVPKDKKKKKKKKKDKGGDEENKHKGTAVASNASDLKNAQLSMAKLRDFQRAMEMFVHQGPAKSIEDAKKKVYNFWDTQPVPKIDEDIKPFINEPVEQDKEDIRSEPFSLPSQFMWDTLDIHNQDILQELYTLLNENYVEDDDNMFRFDYSAEFLIWALTPPGWLQDWHCGVRVAANNKLVGFISGVPANIQIYDKQQRMVEINFLCVHKKLRSKRVAPVLIREITRRVHQQGIFQAVYTAGVVLPKPVATCRYWHRSLNPKKLIDVKFSHIGRNMTLQRTIKLYKLPEKPKLQMRKMEDTDVPICCRLFRTYMMKFSLAPIFNEEEFIHWFMPREGIINTYVLETGGIVTDFISYYTLPSSIMHHPVHKKLKAAYAFYSVSTKTDIVDLMHTALTMAKHDGFDVFNALDLMENKAFLEKLKFGIGDGNLQYYLYNWRCKGMEPHQIGLVLQ